MKGFTNTTKMVSGHHHWGGGSIGTGGTINRLAHGGPVLARDKIDENPGHPEVYPGEGNRTHGNAGTVRKTAPTQELAEHGGRSELTAGFAGGGKAARHFHVHHHHHAGGGKVKTKSKHYAKVERSAERETEGAGPMMAKGGKWMQSAVKRPGAFKAKAKRAGMSTAAYASKVSKPGSGASTRTKRQAALAKTFAKYRPTKKNAGGALYAAGGPTASAMPAGTLGRLAMAPRVPLRRPMALPGGPRAPFATMAGGGSVGADKARQIAHHEVEKHVGYPAPQGHRGLGSMIHRR